MSVHFLDQRDINKILGMVLHHQTEISLIIKGTPSFKTYLQSYFVSPEQKSDEIMKQFITRMFWYATVANKVAFALQYQEDISFKSTTINLQAVEATECSLQQFASNLGYLLYNLATNDGNIFLESKWYEPLAVLRNTLKLAIL